MGQAPNRRTRLMVDKPFQLSFLARFVLLLLIEAALIAALFLYASSGTFTTGYHGTQIYVERTPNFFLVSLSIISAIAAVAMALAGMFIFTLLLHRVVGPAYRLRGILSEIARGDLTCRVQLRKKDRLNEVAYELNQTVESLDRRVGQLKKAVEDLSKSGAGGGEAPRRLKEITDSFKTTS